MAGEWMNLSTVATLLGVHPSTVRNWSDQGVLPVHRTQGGHRRYLRSEIELWIQSKKADGPADFHLVAQTALKSTRFQISEGHLKAESWYMKLSDEDREQYRKSGGALLNGCINFINAEGEQASAEAQALGYEYASRGRRCGMSLSEATHAYLFFRNVLLESMLAVYESASVNSPLAWSDMFRKVTEFTDHILVTLLETYEAYQRVNR